MAPRPPAERPGRRGRSRGRGRGRSVRARLSLATAAAVAVVTLGAGLALLKAVEVALVGPIGGEARARAADVIALGASSPDGRLPRPLPVLSGPWPTLVQVLDEQGALMGASAELAGRPPLLEPSPGRREPTGDTSFPFQGRTQHWRLDAVYSSMQGRPVTVVVATSLAQADRAAGLLRASLVAAVPALTLAAAGLTWLTVGRALRPVEAMRAQVAGFDPACGAGRPTGMAGGSSPGGGGAGPGRPGATRTSVAVPATDDELSRLAGTLNALLDRLATANERQRVFVADASHELRSPLANVRAALEVALAHPASTDWPEVAGEVLGQNERMARLVDDLLLLARADAGATGRRAPVALDRLIHQVAASPSRSGGPVRLQVADPAPITVEGDEGQLLRVIENLVDNGLRHAHQRVTVSLERIGTRAELTVSDDGPGVPPDQRARIFERFVRLDQDRSRRTGGAGLGLAIVAEIVRAHGGSVVVGDANPGAVFSVRLPAVPSGPSAVPSGPSAVPSAPGLSGSP